MKSSRRARAGPLPSLGSPAFQPKEVHRLALENDTTAVLYVGAENWPLPIPLVKTEGSWRFDTEAGKREIVFRRIGRNELAAIRVCHGLVDAEHDYYASAHDGSAIRHYAARFASDSGKQDGLYWRPTAEQPSSPIGPLHAAAGGSTGETPFHEMLRRPRESTQH